MCEQLDRGQVDVSILGGLAHLHDGMGVGREAEGQSGSEGQLHGRLE